MLITNIYTPWRPPNSPIDDTPNVLPLYALGASATQFQMRHLIHIPFTLYSNQTTGGTFSELVRKKFEWQIYEGGSAVNPDYIYIRQKVEAPIIIVGEVLFGVIGNVFIIPGEFKVSTIIFDNKGTDKYVETGPDDKYKTDPENKAWKHTLGGTEFGEQMLLVPTETGEDVTKYVLGDGEFLRWAEGAIYKLNIQPTAKFSVVNPPIGWGDSWTTPLVIRSATYKFRFLIGSSEVDFDEGVNPNRVGLIPDGPNLHLSVGYKGQKEKLRHYFEAQSKPSVVRDTRLNIYTLKKIKEGYWEEVSRDSGRTFGYTQKIWDSSTAMSDYISIPRTHIRATVGITDGVLYFKSSANGWKASEIAELDKIEPWGLTWNNQTLTFQVSNGKFSFFSKDYGLTWQYYNGVPSRTIRIKKGTVATVPPLVTDYKPQMSNGWLVLDKDFKEVTNSGIGYSLGSENMAQISIGSSVVAGQKFFLFNRQEKDGKVIYNFYGIYVEA